MIKGNDDQTEDRGLIYPIGYHFRDEPGENRIVSGTVDLPAGSIEHLPLLIDAYVVPRDKRTERLIVLGSSIEEVQNSIGEIAARYNLPIER